MRSDVIRTYKTLHTWTGLIGGMLLFICFYAGALTMFKEVLNRWASPTHEQPGWVEQQQLPALIDAVLAEYPEAANAFTLHLLPMENAPAPITWQANPGSPELMRGTLDADGELLVSSQRPSALGELVDLLHRTAGIPGEGHHYIGVYVMGFVCVLYMLALVSGLIVLLPTLVSDFFALRKGKNLKRFWLDAHNVVGITSLPFHILIAWSVIVFAFHDQIYDGMQKYVYGEREMFISGAAPPPPEVRPLDGLLPPAVILERIREVSPDFVPREMNYRQLTTLRQSVQVMGEDRNHMVRTGNRGFVTLDPFSGEMIDDNYLPGYENGWMDIVITFFALHFGSFGGYAMRWVYFFLGLAGAFLFYSGNLLWIESRRKRQRRGGETVTQKRNTELMAAATVGVCWGCVAGISAAMAAGKWLHGIGEDPDAWYMTVYYIVFLVSVAWAFVAGAARASVHLLWLCALATLAIPLTGLISLFLPGGDRWPWLHTSADLLVVELTACIAGAVFIYMARRMNQRIHEGVRDSVWAYPLVGPAHGAGPEHDRENRPQAGQSVPEALLQKRLVP